MDDNDQALDWDDDEITSETQAERRPTTSVTRFCVLTLAAGPGAPRDFVLSQQRLTVGRAADVDIRVVSASISRHHMVLERTGPEYACIDAGSRNGVYLNGVKVHSAVLRTGDQIQIGEALFLFQDTARETRDEPA